MRETTPQVRLIASPKIHWDAVYSYLKDVDPEHTWIGRVLPGWRPGQTVPSIDQEASDAELLVEYAGRRCYRSWAPGLNANVTKVRENSGEYLMNILRSKHGAVLEHSQFTFDFNDVSRVFTHELVRHRAGVAISQESLRYVRLTDLGFRIPDVLAEGPRINLLGPCDFSDAERVGAEATADYCYRHQDFCDPDHKQPMSKAVVSIVEHLEEFQKSAAEAFGLDDKGTPFHLKKEVTSALRRLAPLGLSTGMVWSANIRTLRHLIDLRTAPGAEEEIRLVFGQVARIMRRECPLLFADFRPFNAIGAEVNAGSVAGPYHWRPEFEKV